MTENKTTWIVRFAEGGQVSSIDEDRMRSEHSHRAGSTLSYRPMLPKVKVPFVGDDDFAIAYIGNGEYMATYLPWGVLAHGEDPRDAYEGMLRQMYSHLARQQETLVA